MGVLKYKNEDGQWIKQTVLINVDQEMSDSSTGAVANKVIKTYVDSNDTSSLNTAKSYADTKDSEVKSYADSKDTETLNTAKGYTDTKTAQITADIYTKSEVDSKDTETLNSAKSYADTKASAAETNAKSYADTKDTETLNTAKSYTDTKTSTKQDKLTKGNAIDISDSNNISVKYDDSTIKLDENGKLYVAGGGSTGANWSAAEGEDGFISNKPFDVSSGSITTLFENEIFDFVEEEINGFAKQFESSLLNAADLGKTINVTVPTLETMTGTVMSEEYGFGIGYYCVYNYDMDEGAPSAYPSLYMLSMPSHNATICMIYKDSSTHVGETITVSATKGSITTTKLSASKINIDGTTIINDNGVLKAVGGGSSDLIVNITYTPSTTEGEIGTFSADKTFDEILAAYNAGRTIWAKGDALYYEAPSGKDICYFNYIYPLAYYMNGQFGFCGGITISPVRAEVRINRDGVSSELVSYDLQDGIATEIDNDEDGNIVVNVKYDDSTIKLNSDGKLYAVGGSSEDNIYLVNFSMSGENWVADKTFENILAAANANKTVIGKAIGMGDLDAQLVLSGFDSTLIQFDVTFVTSSIVEIIGLTMDPSNVITVIDFGISPPLGEGKAIDISDGEINVKYDDSTIKLNSDGKLYAVGGSGGAVSSVNGKTGTVVLKTSDIENDSNYVTAAHHDSSKVDTSLLGAINGVATLNSQGKVLDSQLPDYMDDVVEGYYFNSKFYKDASHTEEIAGTSGKLYLDTVTSKLYRYSGSSYTEISGGSGASYSAGNGINIADNTISAKVDNNTIKVNSSGQLYTEESGSIATDSYHTTTTFGNDIPMDITFTKYGKVIDLTIQAVSPFYMKVIEKEGVPTWTNNKYKGEYITAGRDGAVVPWEIYTASDATIAYALYPFADGTTGHIRGLYKEPSKFTESSGVITKEEAVIYDEINHVYWTRTWTYTSGVKPDTFTDGSTKSFTYNKTPGSYVGTNQYGLFVDDIVEVPDWAHPATSNATVQGKHLIFNQFDGERELQVGFLTDNTSVTCVHKFYMTLGYDTYNETFADDGTPIHTPLETPKVRLCGSYIRGITMDSTDMETINMMRTDLYKDMTFHITYIAQ